MARMEIPPWHLGHVVRKLMEAQNLNVSSLAEKARVKTNTISNLLRGGEFKDGTLEKVATVLKTTALEIRQECDRSNAAHEPLPGGVALARRATDRDPEEVDAQQYARRILRLPNSASTAIFNMIRAFEEALGLLQRRNQF